jgi:hypothetical protein
MKFSQRFLTTEEPVPAPLRALNGLPVAKPTSPPIAPPRNPNLLQSGSVWDVVWVYRVLFVVSYLECY